MEEVAHRVDEHPARLTPTLRLLQSVRTQGELKAGGEVLGEALGYGLRVAVFAARADLVATRGRVPGLVRPFYRCVRTRHASPPTLNRTYMPGILQSICKCLMNPTFVWCCLGPVSISLCPTLGARASSTRI